MTEAKSALEALDELEDDAAVYKSAGALMVQVKNVDGLKEELSERIEELEVKSKSYEKHEGSLKKTVEDLRTELSAALGQTPQGMEPS